MDDEMRNEDEYQDDGSDLEMEDLHDYNDQYTSEGKRAEEPINRLEQ